MYTKLYKTIYIYMKRAFNTLINQKLRKNLMPIPKKNLPFLLGFLAQGLLF